MSRPNDHDAIRAASEWADQTPSALDQPPAGWIRTVRSAVGITQQELARRMGITAQSAFRLESNERHGTIRIDSLRRVADALDCDVVYALIPREKPLEIGVRGTHDAGPPTASEGPDCRGSAAPPRADRPVRPAPSGRPAPRPIPRPMPRPQPVPPSPQRR